MKHATRPTITRGQAIAARCDHRNSVEQHPGADGSRAGVLGVLYVFTVLVTVTAIGAGAVAAATVTGQLIASVIIDRLGILGLEETPLTPARLIGVALLLVGTYLVVR